LSKLRPTVDIHSFSNWNNTISSSRAPRQNRPFNSHSFINSRTYRAGNSFPILRDRTDHLTSVCSLTAGPIGSARILSIYECDVYPIVYNRPITATLWYFTLSKLIPTVIYYNPERITLQALLIPTGQLG
jgi:hypothetical protein